MPPADTSTVKYCHVHMSLYQYIPAILENLLFSVIVTYRGSRRTAHCVLRVICVYSRESLAAKQLSLLTGTGYAYPYPTGIIRRHHPASRGSSRDHQSFPQPQRRPCPSRLSGLSVGNHLCGDLCTAVRIFRCRFRTALHGRGTTPLHSGNTIFRFQPPRAATRILPGSDQITTLLHYMHIVPPGHWYAFGERYAIRRSMP